jgi:hypothetical protein
MIRAIVITLLALGLFYFAWPAVSAYQIHRALESGDVPTLQNKIDFERLKETLRPAVSTEVERVFSKAIKQTGGEGDALRAHLSAQLAPNLVDTTVAALATPDALIRMYREDATPREYMRRAVSQEMSNLTKVPGFGEIASADAGAAGVSGLEVPFVTQSARQGESSKPGHGLGRIRECSLVGPFAVRCSTTNDTVADKADLVVVFEFRDFDWKVADISLPA